MKSIYLLSAICFLFSFSAVSQNNFNDLVLKIDKDLESFSEKYPQETVSILTDKQEYFAGENIFVSCFVNINGRQSFLSKTLYIELGDESGKIMEKKMLAIEKGHSNAIISIPIDLTSGVYFMNAYSLWMKNAPELIAQKPIVVLGPDYISKPFILQNNSSDIKNVVFIPESNSWSEGQSQNFILQLLDKNKIPLNKNFSIFENTNEIFSGQTDNNGLCKIELTLKKNSIYQLKSGLQQFNLSLQANQGIGLSFNIDNKTKLFVSLQKSASVPSNQFLLVGVDQEKLCYQSVFDFAEGMTATAITKSKLPAGVINFLLFDESLNIVAQRYYFNPSSITSSISSSKVDNNLIIKTDTSVNSSVLMITTPLNQSILGANNLISLIPELQSQYSIQIPDLSPTSLNTIDQLFCLHSSNYIGKKWELKAPELKYIVESGITLRGNIKPYAGKGNSGGYKAELIIKAEDSTTYFSSVQTLPNGDFAIGDLSFQKAAKVYFQGNNTSNSKELLNMQLYPSYFDTLSHLSVLPYIKFEKYYTSTPIPGIQKQFDEFSNDGKYKIMEAVIVKAKIRSKLDSLKQAYLTPLFTDGNSTILQPEGHYINFWQFLRGKAPGLRMEGSIDNPSVYFTRYGGTLSATNNTGEDLSESFGEQPGLLFFLNEVEVSRDVVASLDVNDIALVIINEEPMAALGAYNGMIGIYTKKGVSLGNTTSKSMAFEKRMGYSNYKSVYRLNKEQFKQGMTLFFGPIPKNFHISLPSNFKNKIVLAGWNSNNEFVFVEN
jgi:hypothetical protein